MSFRSDLRKFQQTLEVRTSDAFAGIVMETHRSIVEGSELTGAPGQPVDTGALRASWIVGFDSPDHATISTNLNYAPYIEEGLNSRGPFTLRSAIGGWHSVKLTRAGFQRIVDYVVERVARGR